MKVLVTGAGGVLAEDIVPYLHIANRGKVSWCNFTATILGNSQKSTRVIHVTSDDINHPGRLRNSAFDPSPSLKQSVIYFHLERMF